MTTRPRCSVDRAATEVCHLFDPTVHKVYSYLGWEQEYFLVDESIYSARPDLLLTGRTLLGHESAKNQQLEDHYFGAIPARVQSFMKELEFQCGYPLSSMKEKLYNKNNGEEWGILIYTIGGAEGSYGGLVSLFPSDVTSDGKDSRIVRIINFAAERVKDCPNDPICSDEGGHCYACLDIPEISCCNWNDKLDRKVFIENKEKFDSSSPNVPLD